MCVTARTVFARLLTLSRIARSRADPLGGVQQRFGARPMKTTRVIGTRNMGPAPYARAEVPRRAAQRLPMNTAPPQLSQALAQVKDLERALASSQQDSIVAREQVEVLVKTNARLRELAAAHEHEGAQVRKVSFQDPPSSVLVGTAPLRRRDKAAARAQKLYRQLGVILPDLAGFEPINDCVWEAPGEVPLQREIKHFKSHYQGSDLACRNGEDEVLSLAHEEVRCTTPGSPWKPMEFCLSAGIEQAARPHIDRLLTERIRFRKGGVLYRAGGWFHSLYAIRSGSAKTILLSKDGQDQVAGYHMAGDIIGIDGIGSDIHECQAVALEDMEACPLPFDQVESLARQSDQFRRNLQKLLSQENARARTLMLVLATMRAEKRLAIFLLDLSQRYRSRGYSSCEFVLRMTREEIGSYLGLKLETVSRMFSRFQREGLIRVDGRAVKLLDHGAMNQLVECGA